MRAKTFGPDKKTHGGFPGFSKGPNFVGNRNLADSKVGPPGQDLVVASEDDGGIGCQDPQVVGYRLPGASVLGRRVDLFEEGRMVAQPIVSIHDRTIFRPLAVRTGNVHDYWPGGAVLQRPGEVVVRHKRRWTAGSRALVQRRMLLDR